MAEKQTNEMRCNMKHDNQYEDFEPDTFESYREKLGNSYFELETALNKMDGLLHRAKEHPAQVSKDEAKQAQKFIEDVGELIQSYFILFVGMSED